MTIFIIQESMEIEKKYLIKDGQVKITTPSFLKLFPSIESLVRKVAQHGESIRQGYLPLETAKLLCDKINLNVSFEVSEARIRERNNKQTFTLKGEGDLVREEKEVTITKELFEAYWTETEGKRVEKLRLRKPYEGYTAEFDVYINRLLIIAEIEFPSVEVANKIPPLGEDITANAYYKNKNLAL